MTQSFWNQNSYLNIKLGEQLSLKAFIFLTILVKLYLAKMCPIFASSASNCLTRYKQILSDCSLGCKNALNFTCLTMKCHNRVHTIAGDAKKINVCLFLDRLFLNRCLLDQVNYTFSASERRGVIPFKLKGNVKA